MSLYNGTPALWETGTDYTTIGDVDLASNVLDVTQAFMRDASSRDYDIELISGDKFGEIYDKSNQTIHPTKAWVEKLLPSVFHFAQQPSDDDYVLHLRRVTVLDDLITASGTPDAPMQYYKMLIYSLAYDLSDEYNLPLSERNYLGGRASNLQQNCRKDDVEDVDNEIKEGAY